MTTEVLEVIFYDPTVIGIVEMKAQKLRLLMLSRCVEVCVYIYKPH